MPSLGLFLESDWSGWPARTFFWHPRGICGSPRDRALEIKLFSLFTVGLLKQLRNVLLVILSCPDYFGWRNRVKLHAFLLISLRCRRRRYTGDFPGAMVSAPLRSGLVQNVRDNVEEKLFPDISVRSWSTELSETVSTPGRIDFNSLLYNLVPIPNYLPATFSPNRISL